MQPIIERREAAQKAEHDAYEAYQAASRSGNNWRDAYNKYQYLSRETFRLKQIETGKWPDDKQILTGENNV